MRQGIISAIKYVPPKRYVAIKTPEVAVGAPTDIFSQNLANVTAMASNLKVSSDDLLTMSVTSGEPMNSDKVINGVRLKKELDKLQKTINEGDEIIIKMNFLDPNDKHSPLIFLINATAGSQLDKDLKDNNIPGIKIAVYFPDGQNVYPIAPPTIRIVSPIFVRQSGRVTEGGSICMNTLYSGEWSPASTIRTVLISASDIMSNDGVNEPGRVDTKSRKKEYTYEDYDMSFDRTAKFHGFQSIK